MGEIQGHSEISVTTEGMKKIPEMVEYDGLNAVVLCDHGIGRSALLARRLNKIPGIKAIHVVGGLGNLRLKTPDEMKKYAAYLKDVQHIFLTLDETEVNDDKKGKFGEVVKEIDSQRGSHKTVVIRTGEVDKAIETVAQQSLEPQERNRE